MATDIASRRVPWIALALSLLSAGVGHLYCGRITKGLPMYLAWLLVPLCISIAALRTPSTMNLTLLVLLPVATVLVVYCFAAIDSWRLANQIGADYSLRDYNRPAVYGLLIVVQLVVSIGLVAGVRDFVYEAFVIPTSSMSPTILNGDRILARKLLPPNHFPERGDLIVFRNPTSSKAIAFVKRIVAVAGDHVEIRGDRLLVNGNELAREDVPQEDLARLGKQLSGRIAYEVNSGHRYLVAYSDDSKQEPAHLDFEATVPERQVFVLGDNRSRSRDSRHFGSIRWTEIVGYVDYIFWPSESWSRLGVVDDRLP